MSKVPIKSKKHYMKLLSPKYVLTEYAKWSKERLIEALIEEKALRLISNKKIAQIKLLMEKLKRV